MSRTFGNAAPGGGIGVRMMVPLVDVSGGPGAIIQLHSCVPYWALLVWAPLVLNLAPCVS